MLSNSIIISIKDVFPENFEQRVSKADKTRTRKAPSVCRQKCGQMNAEPPLSVQTDTTDVYRKAGSIIHTIRRVHVSMECWVF